MIIGKKTEENFLKNVILLRDHITNIIRNELKELGCIEVVTPTLCPFPDIAPMLQYSLKNILDDLSKIYLKIAPTEYLKRYLVKGIERVYEFSINFRPENADKMHLSEFTSLEVMIKDYSYKDMQNLIEKICKKIINSVLQSFGRTSILDRKKIDLLLSPWYTVSLPIFLKENYDFSRDQIFIQESVINLRKELIGYHQICDITTAMDEIITFIAKQFEGPVYIEQYPYYLGGPARLCNEDKRFKERCELFLSDLELANMSSNLTDITEIKKWYYNIAEDSKNNQYRPNAIDTALIKDLETGLPDSAVFGLGIERLLVCILCTDDIKFTRPFSFNELFKDK